MSFYKFELYLSYHLIMRIPDSLNIQTGTRDPGAKLGLIFCELNFPSAQAYSLDTAGQGLCPEAFPGICPCSTKTACILLTEMFSSLVWTAPPHSPLPEWRVVHTQVSEKHLIESIVSGNYIFPNGILFFPLFFAKCFQCTSPVYSGRA